MLMNVDYFEGTVKLFAHKKGTFSYTVTLLVNKSFLHPSKNEKHVFVTKTIKRHNKVAISSLSRDFLISISFSNTETIVHLLGRHNTKTNASIRLTITFDRS